MMQERKCTNISSLFFCVGFVILLFGLVGYSGTKSDLKRLTKGYDDCGNICGSKNKDLGIPKCTYVDMTSKPKVKVDSVPYSRNASIMIQHYSCIDKCENNYVEVFNRCYKKEKESEEVNLQDFLTEMSEDLVRSWPKMLLTCFIAFIFSYIVLILFRYAIEYIIWIIYIGFVAFLGIGALASWIWLVTAKTSEEKTSALVLAILLTIFTLITIAVLYWFRKRIKLVAQLFKEASKSLIDVPSVLFEPILTFLSMMISIGLFVFFLILIQTAGTAKDQPNIDGTTHVEFAKDAGITFANTINIIAFIWFTQFILGCQHFIIGGTISKWYFARNKTKLDSPLMTTFSHLVRFHLGSVCMGSMIITLIKIIRMIIESLRKQAREGEVNLFVQCLLCCIAWILEQIEELLKYLIRNAYIIVAKDGTPLFQSGKKAFNLLFRNLMDVIALNQFGDIVLVVARLFIMGISMFVGYELMNTKDIHNVWVPVVLTGIFAFLIAHCFIAVFEMTVDTIFLCFCEDCEENDGSTRPFYMSPELMDVMKKLKEEAGGEFNFGGGGGAHQPIMPYEPQPGYPSQPDPYQPGFYPPSQPDPYQPGYPSQPGYPPSQPDPYYQPGTQPPYPQQPNPYNPAAPYPPYPGNPPQQQQPGFYPPQPPYNPNQNPY